MSSGPHEKQLMSPQTKKIFLILTSLVAQYLIRFNKQSKKKFTKDPKHYFRT